MCARRVHHHWRTHVRKHIHTATSKRSNWTAVHIFRFQSCVHVATSAWFMRCLSFVLLLVLIRRLVHIAMPSYSHAIPLATMQWRQASKQRLWFFALRISYSAPSPSSARSLTHTYTRRHTHVKLHKPAYRIVHRFSREQTHSFAVAHAHSQCLFRRVHRYSGIMRTRKHTYTSTCTHTPNDWYLFSIFLAWRRVTALTYDKCCPFHFNCY